MSTAGQVGAFTGRTGRLLDAALIVWVLGWIACAVAIKGNVDNLGHVSTTMVAAGHAVQQTGRALMALDGLPFIGSRIGHVAGTVTAAGVGAEQSGAASRASVHHLSVLLAFAVGLIPTIPILVLYVPFRLSWLKEVRAVRRAMVRFRGDPMFDEFLARRATENLPYHQLREISPNPWRDIAEGDPAPLADAELRRLGLTRPRAR